MNGRVAYFECFCGASGDMILGALVDAGLPVEALASDVAQLHCDEIRFQAESVKRCGIRATQVHVHAEPLAGLEHSHGTPGHHGHRGLSDIRKMISSSSLPERVRQQAIAVFERLGEAEAEIHGVGIEEVHFHEVGALDSIADIVGAVAGLDRLGVDRVFFSTLNVGGGTVQTSHGLLPVPAPATARLIRGLKTQMGPIQMELLTPTAAAILTTLGTQAELEPLRLDQIGYGAGSRDPASVPNVLRVLIGQSDAAESEADSVWVLESNLDDTTPEVCGFAIERLLAEGALDAFAIPIQMKKSRPGLLLSALVESSALRRVEEVFFRETSTFGVRRHRVERAKLAREFREVTTPFGPVKMKLGIRNGDVLTAAPEYEDCRRLAIEKKVPLREVMDAARRAFGAERA